MFSKLFLVLTATILLPANYPTRNHSEADAALELKPHSVVDKKLTYPCPGFWNDKSNPDGKPYLESDAKNGPPTL